MVIDYNDRLEFMYFKACYFDDNNKENEIHNQNNI